MYTPAFTEVFVGYVAILFWAAWLGRKGQAPGFHQWLPFALGLLLLGAQALVTVTVMHAGDEGPDEAAIATARWGSFAVVVAMLLAEVGFTLRHLSTLRKAPPPGSG